MRITQYSAALAIIWCAGLAQSQSEIVNSPISVDQAVKLGLARNPQVAAGLASVAASRATYLALGVPVPLTLGASQVTGSSNAASLGNNNTDTILSVMGTIDLSGQRRYQAAVANSNFQSNHYQFLETLLSLERDIRDAYWSLAAAQSLSEIAKDSLAESDRVYQLTVSQERAGSAPHGDVVRSSIDVANAKQASLAAKNALHSAQIAFNKLLSQSPDSAIQIAASLGENSAPMTTELIPTLSELTKESKQNRPLLRSSAAQSRAANYAVKQAESSRFPDFNAVYQRSVQQQVDALTLTLSFPLFDFGGIKHTVNATKQQRKQAEALQKETEEQVAEQVSQAYNDLQTAVESAASFKREILTPSQTLLEMALLGYQQGATGILPVIDAEATIRNAKTGYVSSLLAIYKAQDELLSAVGKAPFPLGK